MPGPAFSFLCFGIAHVAHTRVPSFSTSRLFCSRSNWAPLSSRATPRLGCTAFPLLSIVEKIGSLIYLNSVFLRGQPGQQHLRGAAPGQTCSARRQCAGRWKSHGASRWVQRDRRSGRASTCWPWSTTSTTSRCLCDVKYHIMEVYHRTQIVRVGRQPSGERAMCNHGLVS